MAEKVEGSDRARRLSVRTLETVATAAAFSLLHVLGLVGSLHLWVLLALLVGALALGEIVGQFCPVDAPPLRHHVRMAVQMLTTTVIIYAIGWGPALAVGYIVIASEDLRNRGSSAWRPAMVWACVGLIGGQVAIVTGLVPSYVPEPEVHGLALLVGLGVVFIIRLLGLKTQAVEEKTAALEAESAQRALAEEGLRHSESRFRSLVHNSFDVVTVTNDSGEITYTSPSVERVLGYLPEEYMITDGTARVHPDDLDEASSVTAAVRAEPLGERTWEVRLRHRDGSFRWHEVTLRNLLDDPAVQGLVANHRDITDRKADQDRLAHEAAHDPLTGLPNRKAFLERLDAALRSGRESRSPVALLFVDLDRFKLINDTLGHLAGDRLLVGVANRLVAATRPADVVARLSGDEFIILLEDASDPGQVAERIAAELHQPIELEGRLLVVTASLGVAISAASTDSPEVLLSKADLAMYAAKEGGRARAVVYDPKETPQFVERVDLEAGLRSALANREFVLHYQPIIDPTSLQIAGFEALIRWQHPVRGLFAPSEFIWLAEDTGLIEPIGQWVLDQACTTLAVWRQELDCPALKMSINVSAVQLHQPGFAALVAAVTRDHGLPPSSLILEVTERVLVRPEQTVEALEELRALGVAIALDDFGTGYSSLSYLRRLPLDYIKVDRSFIQDICGETGDSSIVRAITGLAASLGLAVIAEGVETEAQAAVVVSLGCELAQGYLYGKPQTQAAAESLIAQRNRQPVRPVSRGAR